MMMEGDDSVPMCDSCGHRHVQGVRCTICGHVGKSQIFTKMRAKGAEGRSIKVEVVNGPTLPFVEGGVEYNQRLYSFIQLRMQVCRELSIPGKEESDPNAELASMHAMCLVGDSPVSVVRWHYQNDVDGRCGMIVDRLVGPQTYHNKGYAYRCLYTAFLTAKQSGAPIDYVVTYVPSVPEYAWAGHKLGSMGFQIVSDAPQYVWCRTNMHTMRLELRRTVDGNGAVFSELDNILGYLLQKSSLHA